MTTQRRGEETRSHLLQAAEDCFAQSGYDGTSVAEICRGAGVSKGAFYHHFPSKQDIFLELLDRWMAALEGQLRRVRAESDTVPEAFLSMTEMVRFIFQTAGDRLPMFLEFWTQAAHDPAVWQATIAPYRQFRAFFAEMIEDGIAEGSLRPLDPEKAAQAVVSLAVGVLLQSSLDPQGADWGQVAYEGIQMLLPGLAEG